MKLTVNENGFFLGSQRISDCKQAYFENIRHYESVEIVLRIVIDEIEVKCDGREQHWPRHSSQEGRDTYVRANPQQP